MYKEVRIPNMHSKQYNTCLSSNDDHVLKFCLHIVSMYVMTSEERYWHKNIYQFQYDVSKLKSVAFWINISN